MRLCIEDERRNHSTRNSCGLGSWDVLLTVMCLFSDYMKIVYGSESNGSKKVRKKEAEWNIDTITQVS